MSGAIGGPHVGMKRSAGGAMAHGSGMPMHHMAAGMPPMHHPPPGNHPGMMMRAPPPHPPPPHGGSMMGHRPPHMAMPPMHHAPPAQRQPMSTGYGAPHGHPMPPAPPSGPSPMGSGPGGMSPGGGNRGGAGYGAPPAPGGGNSGGGMPSVQVQVPDEMMGRVIGKAGAAINEIRQLSGCRIDIGGAATEGMRLVTITGTPEQAQMAQYMISVKMAGGNPSQVLPQAGGYGGYQAQPPQY